MSIRSRLSRAKLGKTPPNVYDNLPEQATRIIQDIKNNLKEARSYYDDIPATYKEWDRLRQDNIFKNEALPEYIASFEDFMQEFGTCTKGTRRLKKIDKHYKTWTKHTTRWR